jgi:hypothetical protein
MTGSIVCGFDASESAKGAARVARELSARLLLRLVFVRVVEDGAPDAKVAAIAARLHDFADVNGNDALPTSFPGLANDGHAGVAGGIVRSISAAERARSPCRGAARSAA